MKTKLWPNGIGWDVGQHEVFKRPDGRLLVTIFRSGEVVRTWIAERGMSPEDAVLQAKMMGYPVGDLCD